MFFPQAQPSMYNSFILAHNSLKQPKSVVFGRFTLHLAYVFPITVNVRKPDIHVPDAFENRTNFCQLLECYFSILFSMQFSNFLLLLDHCIQKKYYSVRLK
jgi:vacuolar-type H+-ATPase subunit I/STV1